MADYEMAPLDEIQMVDEGDGRAWRQVRAHFGIAGFGVNAWTADSGKLINEHDEQDTGQEELYIVTSGRATFMLDGVERDAPAGTYVYVKPNVKRYASAAQPGTTCVVLGGKPGSAYEVANWEAFAPAFKLYEKGEHAAAADMMGPLTEEHPAAVGFYNLACMEALCGRHAQALDHLRRSLSFEGEPDMVARLRKLAREDSDLDSIRQDPAFPKDL